MHNSSMLALLGLAAFSASAASANAVGAAAGHIVRVAQANVADQPASGTPAPGSGPGAPAGSSTVQPPIVSYAPVPTAPASKPPPAPILPSVSQPGGTSRNNVTGLSNGSQPDPGTSGPGNPTGTFGAPATNAGTPVYGSATRDPASLGPPSVGAPATLGGPINGTAIPSGSIGTSQFSTNGGGSSINGLSGAGRPAGSTNQDASLPNLRPLGSVPNTRDPSGTFSGQGGYNRQGIYTGTATQTNGNGYGYGSTYATTGRPIGGLLSNNVDATGPLRPYIPLNGGPIGHPNSGYGIPNGSRPSRMDGRGVQRVN